jgi:hypothetical protein
VDTVRRMRLRRLPCRRRRAAAAAIGPRCRARRRRWLSLRCFGASGDVSTG